MVLIFCLFNLFLLVICAAIFNNLALLVVGGIGCLVLGIAMKGRYNQFGYTVMVAELIAFAFMLLQYWGSIEQYGKPYYAGDDELFEYYGHMMYGMNIYWPNKIPYLPSVYSARGFLPAIAIMDKIGACMDGFHTVQPRILNLYLWMTTAVLTCKIASEHIKNTRFSTRFSQIGLLCLSIFPNALYISSFVYRDTMVVFFIIVFTYNAIMLKNEIQLQHSFKNLIIRILLLCISLYSVYYIRITMVIVILINLVIILCQNQLDKVRGLYKAIALCVVGVGVLLILYFMDGFDLLSKMSDGYSNLLLESTDGLSNIVFGMPIFPFGIILKGLYGLADPFPVAILSLPYGKYTVLSCIRALVYIGTIVQLFFLPYLIKGIKRMDTSAFMFLTIYFAVTLSTFTFRHFIMIYPFAAPIIMKEFSLTSKKQKKNYFIRMLLLLSFCFAAYLLFKL